MNSDSQSPWRINRTFRRSSSIISKGLVTSGWLLKEERVIGTIALLDIGDSQAALRKMFVAAEYRGGRPGIAHQLLATLLSHARGQGVREIYLGTTDKFLAAHRFYEKNGFQLVEPDTLPPRFPKMKVDTRFYRLSLC